MKYKKRHITLLEIMIVIFLISIIGSVVGYNMKGAIDKGKRFKTEHAISQINDILLLEAGKGDTYESIAGRAANIIAESGLIKEPAKFMNDGWGHPFVITENSTKDGFIITSKGCEDHHINVVDGIVQADQPKKVKK
jgi:general secretion pathway protein G